LIFIIVDRLVNRFKQKILAPSPCPKGVKDEPSDEKGLRETLERIGFHVLDNGEQITMFHDVKRGKASFGAGLQTYLLIRENLDTVRV